MEQHEKAKKIPRVNIESERIQVVSCGCAVIRHFDEVAHVLLVKPWRGRDIWGIPKGHINPGEKKIDCAQRETREEAGINVNVIQRLSPVVTKYRNETKTVTTFLATQSDNMTPYIADGENDDVRYFPLTALPEIHKYQIPLLDEIKSIVLYANPDALALGFPPQVYEKLKFIATYVTEDDWSQFKRELLNLLSPVNRKIFSTRDPVTKLQALNDFELRLAEHWKELTGIILKLRSVPVLAA